MSTIYINADIDIETEDIVDQLDNREKLRLAQALELDKLKKAGQLKITPRQLLYELRRFDIDLPGLRDAIIEHFPLKVSDESGN